MTLQGACLRDVPAVYLHGLPAISLGAGIGTVVHQCVGPDGMHAL